MLEKLLVFSLKIEDLTFLTLVYFKRREKRKIILVALKLPVRKDKAYL